MAKIPVTFVQEGYENIHSNLTTLKKETKAITQSKVKISIDNKDIQEALKAQGALERALVDLQKSYDQLGNKSSAAAKKIKKDTNEIANALKNFETAVQWSGKTSKTVQDTAKMQSYTKEIYAQTSAEEKKTKVLKDQATEIKKTEKLLDEWQDAYRKVERAKEDMLNGKKVTPSEFSYLLKTLEMTEKELLGGVKNVEAFKGKAKGAAAEFNKLAKHVKDAMQFTKDNTKETIARDKVIELRKQWEKLETDREKALAKYGESSQQVQEITRQQDALVVKEKEEIAVLEKALELERNKKNADKDGIRAIQERLAYLKQEGEDRRKITEAGRVDAQNQQQQKQNYQSLKSDLQDIWNLENRLAELQKDPKKHLSEIQYIQKLLGEKREQLNLEQRISTLTDDQADDIKRATKAQSELNGKIKAQGEDWKKNNQKVSELGDTIKKVFNYVLVYRGFQMLQEGIQKCLDTMKELDKAFTDIRLVTGGTQEETNQLAQDYNQLAKELGATTQEVAEGASEWLRQGKTTEETTELLKSSMTLSKVGAIESAEATELLTSSLNGYKLEAQDAMTVVDKISSIDLEAATSSYELATALARTANIANDSQVSFDKLLAMIGTVSSVTRKSASTIRRII